MTLPAHSPLGASAAERWMNCPGSVKAAQVVRQMERFDEGDPEYRKNGTLAHELGARCLQEGIDAWQLVGVPGFDMAMERGISCYVNYVERLVKTGATLDVEQRMHRPEIHPMFYGTLDAALLWTSAIAPLKRLEIVDYKHGEGILVEVEDNAQESYYAVGKVVELNLADDTPVRLTIVQPNAFHPDGPIRSYDTTAGRLRRWLWDRLVPAMERGGAPEYKIGDWCRFCPAALACPAYDDLVERVLRDGTCTYREAQALKIIIKRREEQEFKDLMSGLPGTGGKLVHKQTYRVWKHGAETKLVGALGTAAWKEPELISPAVAEKLPGGDVLVAELAWQPPSPDPTVAILESKKKDWHPQKASEVFKKALPAA